MIYFFDLSRKKWDSPKLIKAATYQKFETMEEGNMG